MDKHRSTVTEQQITGLNLGIDGQTAQQSVTEHTFFCAYLKMSITNHAKLLHQLRIYSQSNTFYNNHQLQHQDKQRMPIEAQATCCYIPRTAKSSQTIANAKRN